MDSLSKCMFFVLEMEEIIKRMFHKLRWNINANEKALVDLDQKKKG